MTEVVDLVVLSPLSYLFHSKEGYLVPGDIMGNPMVINLSIACWAPAQRKTNPNTGYVSGFVEINLPPS